MKKYALTVLVAILLFAVSANAAPAKKHNQWTLMDTVSSALDYSPEVKSRREGVHMAKESVRQAKSGHMPKIDIDARSGFGSLPVSKYD